MNNLVNELRQARSELITAIEKVGGDKSRDQFIGDWNLKDLVAHLSQIKSLL